MLYEKLYLYWTEKPISIILGSIKYMPPASSVFDFRTSEIELPTIRKLDKIQAIFENVHAKAGRDSQTMY